MALRCACQLPDEYSVLLSPVQRRVSAAQLSDPCSPLNRRQHSDTAMEPAAGPAGPPCSETVPHARRHSQRLRGAVPRAAHGGHAPGHRPVRQCQVQLFLAELPASLLRLHAESESCLLSDVTLCNIALLFLLLPPFWGLSLPQGPVLPDSQNQGIELCTALPRLVAEYHGAGRITHQKTLAAGDASQLVSAVQQVAFYKGIIECKAVARKHNRRLLILPILLHGLRKGGPSLRQSC